jgi:hypothetical protein
MSAHSHPPTPTSRVVTPPRGSALLLLRLVVEAVLGLAALVCAVPLAVVSARPTRTA